MIKLANNRAVAIWADLKCYLYLWFIDHGILRAPYSNFHVLDGPFYRANQPGPSKIRQYKRKYGLKTIVNLRGDNPLAPWQRLESGVCNQQQIKLVNIRVLSREAPSKEVIRELKMIIETMELPALAHCKSGADRGGLFAVLYRHFRLGHPIEEAIQELSWKYGHFKSSKTGIIDFVFETYLDSRKPGQSFMDWIEHDYDQKSLRRKFKATPWSRFFVDQILRRE